jgi:hypothetical protein
MKIVWKDFNLPISLDARNLKQRDNFYKINEIFLKIDCDNNNIMNQDDIALCSEMLELIAAEYRDGANQKYYASIEDCFDLYRLITNKAAGGVHFRLEDGRQIGPITSLNMLFEQAGDDAIILSYGVQTGGIPTDSPRRSFTKAALSKIRKNKYANGTSSMT